MTIACCYVVPEGIVLGSDSTITTSISDRPQYLNHNQKIFEIGMDSNLGIITWGLTAFPTISYRSLIALVADDFAANPPLSVLDATNHWNNRAWDAYRTSFATEMERYREIEWYLQSLSDPNDPKAAPQRDEINYLANALSCGFCIAGYVDRDRNPCAYEIEFRPNLRSQPIPRAISRFKHFGQDGIVSRIIGVFDDDIKRSILGSGNWLGSENELQDLSANLRLERPDMTIRDAIDFVHFTIYATIKATKFSTRDKDCGGPIELAVITTDRKFRWVRHKGWDSAISDWTP